MSDPSAPRPAVHINPDHFLETENGRVTTPELNFQAWQRCYKALDEALRAATPNTRVYVMVGPQGSGKSTWVRANAPGLRDAIVFDAILVKRSERETVLVPAYKHRVRAVAVWMRTPLDLCISRNAARPEDEVVPEQAIRNVFAAVEPPSLDEGFERVIEVSADSPVPEPPGTARR